MSTERTSEVGRSLTPAEVEAMLPDMEWLTRNLDALAIHGGVEKLLEVCIGLLLRLGLKPRDIWRGIAFFMPEEARAAELHAAEPANSTPC